MNSRPFTVHFYEGEASLTSKWTLQYPNIETGGDLFGLWLNESEVVIQAVLGPGQNCRRTTNSFLQDEQYLNNVAELLIHNEGLCIVGSWRSHHTMNIPEPSRGDSDTVWRYMPTPGRFLLLIATIETKTGAPIVQMGFNLFESTSEGNKMIPMKLEILQGQSPIRANKTVSSQIFEGAEVTAEMNSRRMSYPEAQNPEPSVPSSLTQPEGNQESEAVEPEITAPEVNVTGSIKPNMKASPGYDEDSDFFKVKGSGRRGHWRSHDQNKTVSNEMFEGAKVSSKKTSYPEPSVQSSLTKPDVAGPEVNVQTSRKPGMKKRYNDGSDFFRGQESGRRGNRRSHDQNIACDNGVCSSFLLYNTSPRSEVRHPRSRYKEPPEFTFSYYKLSNSRQGMKLQHYGHSLGSCQDCRNIKVRRRRDGEMYAEHGKEEFCTIL